MSSRSAKFIALRLEEKHLMSFVSFEAFDDFKEAQKNINLLIQQIHQYLKRTKRGEVTPAKFLSLLPACFRQFESYLKTSQQLLVEVSHRNSSIEALERVRDIATSLHGENKYFLESLDNILDAVASEIDLQAESLWGARQRLEKALGADSDKQPGS